MTLTLALALALTCTHSPSAFLVDSSPPYLLLRSNHAFLRSLGHTKDPIDTGGDSDDDRPATRANQIRRK